ncbi:hypothetical protein [uncultured Bacteroides sp.]|uniref:hypothetical protein n=1 Tax=uncultured Bacteroides sp. TaxID=162156 RepID=UPI00261EBF30|nr:hypothetical protein [uncultured Bacteroides sp.]
MKKITLSLLALLPMSLFAQAPAISSGSDYGYLLFTLLIGVLIFIVCRELLCWYWKINKMIANQDEIIRLLKKIADENNTPLNDNKLREEKRNIL